MLPYEDALLKVLETVQPLPACQWPTAEAAGRVLAEAVTAQWDMPRCHNSAMDGYAINAHSSSQNSALEIVGSSFAGQPFHGCVAEGQAIRITTGAPLPEGTDTILPVEDVDEDAGKLFVESPFTAKQHVRMQGEEFKEGQELLQSGALLHAGEISLLACAGVEDVKVYPKPQVAIISTGDELVELGSKPGRGQVINSNLYYLSTRLNQLGCVPLCVGIGKDNKQSLDQCITQALAADLIISTGGVSVGEKDQVQSTLEAHNFQKIFWKVAIKPGKPLLFGQLGNKPFFGLPGNPAATASTFELFVVPALRKMSGKPDCRAQKRTGILTRRVENKGKRQAFLWSRLEWSDGQYRVIVQAHQGSGQHSSIQGANALLSLPAGSGEINQGSQVEVLLLEH